MHSLRLLRSISPTGRTCVGLKHRNFCLSAQVPEFESDYLHDEAKYIEKDIALRMALTQLSGDFTHESMLSLKKFFRKRRAPVVPTGSLKLDEALGIGGLPKGRMVEIYGREASGKTTLALHVAALVPQCELDVVIGGTHRDEQSRIMTKVRANVKSAGRLGPADEVTCGGNALKFYAAIRLRMVKTGLLKTEDEATGLSVCIEVVKNKLAPAMKKAELQIQFGKGFYCVPEVLHLACDYGVVMNEGSNYFIGGEIFRSTQAAEQYLAGNGVVLEDIVKTLRGHIFNREI
ncbi:hypothetical protein ACFE04_013700 [Oxalis oulophora]